MQPSAEKTLNVMSIVAFGLGTSSMMIFAIQQMSLVIIMAYLLFGITGLALVLRAGSISIRIYATVYGFAAFAAVGLYIIYTSTHGVPYWGGGSDELKFEAMGLAFAQGYGLFEYGQIRTNLVSESHNSVGYIYLVGLLVRFCDVFGQFHTMVPRLFNAGCLGLLSVLVFQLGLRLGLQKNTAIRAALFTGCLPLMMWVSVQTLRDVVIALFLMLIAFLWIPDRYERWRYPVPVLIGLSLPLLLAIWEFRLAYVYVAAIMIGIALLSNRHLRSPMQLLFITLPLVVISGIGIMEIYTTLSVSVLNIFGSIGRYAEFRGPGGSGGGLSTIVFSTPIFPMGWIYRTAYALVSPLPVKFIPLDYGWLSLGTVVRLLFLPFLFMGVRRAIKDPVWRIVFVMFLMLFSGMAMITFTFRHITQFLPYAVLLTALGYENYKKNPMKVFYSMGTAGLLLGLLYLTMKIY